MAMKGGERGREALLQSEIARLVHDAVKGQEPILRLSAAVPSRAAGGIAAGEVPPLNAVYQIIAIG